jgi:flagellar hook-associated protein 2
VGVGYIQYKLPTGETKDIYVDSDNSNLSAIAKLINKNSDMGVSANVINDGSGSDTPWRLVLSLNATGDEKAAEFPYFYFVDGDEDFQLEFQREAHDAKVKLDGFEIEAPENKLKELIPGLTIDLKKAKPGEEFTIKISEDVEAVGAKVGDLVGKLNAVLKFIKEQNSIDEKTDTSRTLGGDIMLQSLQSRIHAAVFKDVNTESGYHRVAELGMSFNRDGLIEFDQKKFQAAISGNYNMASQILTGYIDEEGQKSEGFMDNLNTTVNNSLRMPDGLIQSRKKTLQGSIEQIDRRIAQKQKYLEEKEKNLKDKFSRLEGTISKIKTQGAGVASLGGGGGSPVQELG